MAQKVFKMTSVPNFLGPAAYFDYDPIRSPYKIKRHFMYNLSLNSLLSDNINCTMIQLRTEKSLPCTYIIYLALPADQSFCREMFRRIS